MIHQMLPGYARIPTARATMSRRLQDLPSGIGGVLIPQI
jgi:hypothetical protein